MSVPFLQHNLQSAKSVKSVGAKPAARLERVEAKMISIQVIIIQIKGTVSREKALRQRES
jgi:hypothetical protein